MAYNVFLENLTLGMFCDAAMTSLRNILTYNFGTF